MRITLVIAVACLLVTLAQAGDEKQDVRTLKGHTKDVRAIAFNADGTLLATGGNDQTVRIWDTATGKELHTLKADDRLRVEAAAFSPDGKLLASAGWDA